MPQGSVAEWRARIGSSWCALGRPFKTRSPFRGSAGQSKTAKLTLNEVVTMMMILIVFVGANLAFRAFLIGGHYREIPGIRKHSNTCRRKILLQLCRIYRQTSITVFEYI